MRSLKYTKMEGGRDYFSREDITAIRRGLEDETRETFKEYENARRRMLVKTRSIVLD